MPVGEEKRDGSHGFNYNLLTLCAPGRIHTPDTIRAYLQTRDCQKKTKAHYSFLQI